MDPLLRAHLQVLANTGKNGQVNLTEAAYPAVSTPGAEKSGGGAAKGKPVGKATGKGNGKTYPSVAQKAMESYEILSNLDEEQLDYVLDNLSEEEQEELDNMINFCEAIMVADYVSTLSEEEIAELAEDLDEEEIEGIEEAVEIAEIAETIDEEMAEEGDEEEEEDEEDEEEEE
jgi:hypothetical protein